MEKKNAIYWMTPNKVPEGIPNSNDLISKLPCELLWEIFARLGLNEQNNLSLCTRQLALISRDERFFGSKIAEKYIKLEMELEFASQFFMSSVPENITCLRLDKTQVTDKMIENLINFFPNLQTLNLSSSTFEKCDIGCEGAAALAELLKKTQNITNLNLWGNRIGSKGAEELAKGLKSNHSLTSFDLGGNRIGDEGALAVTKALKENRSLTTIILAVNGIGDKGGVALAEALKENRSLTFLNLNGNQIYSTGAVALAEAVKERQSLTWLKLNGDQIHNEGAAALAATRTCCLKYTD